MTATPVGSRQNPGLQFLSWAADKLAACAAESSSGASLGASIRLIGVVALMLCLVFFLPFKGQTKLDVKTGVAMRRSVPVENVVVALRPAQSEKSARLSASIPKALSKLPLGISPQAVCDIISRPGVQLRWSESLLFPNEWECIESFKGLTQKGESGDAPKNSIFAMARGSDAKTLSYIRIKLSVSDVPGGLLDGARILQDLAASTMRAVGRSLPAQIEASLKTLTPVRLEADGMTFMLSSEKMLRGRYNLIINFGSNNNG